MAVPPPHKFCLISEWKMARFGATLGAIFADCSNLKLY